MPKYNDFELDVQKINVEVEAEVMYAGITVYTNCSCDGRLTGCFAIMPD